MTGRGFALIAMGAFGGLWAFLAVRQSGIETGIALAASLPPALGIAALTPRSLRFGSQSATPASRRAIRFAAFGEIALIAAGVPLLLHFHLAWLIPFAVAALVGFHFLPMAAGLGLRRYRLAGGAILLAAAVAALLPDRNTGTMLLEAAVAGILWATAASLAFA